MKNHINWKDTIHFCPNSEFMNPTKPDLFKLITIKIRVWKKHNIKNIFLRTCPEGEEVLTGMNSVRKDRFFEYFETTIEIITSIFNFRFMLVTDDNKIYHYNKRGLQSSMPLDIYDFKLLTDDKTADWYYNTIFYQIFPDRFYNGNPDRNYIDNEYTYFKHPVRSRKWNSKPQSFENGFHLDFYNGDLDGVLKKIYYLQELGINGIYLNPIFTALSNHKYDTLDFYEIDKHLGDKKLFSKLTDTIHKQNMHIILDGVFNHTGIACKWFNALNYFGEEGAYNSIESEYSEFYTFYEHPNQYEMWLGVKSLPKLNYKSEKLKDIIYRNDDSIMQYWMKQPFNIDGWRFDVANMLARQRDFQQHIPVWQEIYSYLKNVNPDAYLMGEHFFDGTELLNQNCLDGLMNYQGFYFPVFRWLTKSADFHADHRGFKLPVNISAMEVYNQMSEFLSIIPWQKQLKMYNLLNSHDRPRIISMLDNNIDKLKSAVIFLFCYPGIPSIYYGDEIGLGGMGDPDCRRCMNWNESEWNQSLLSLYKKLIKLRKTSPALQFGSIKWLLVTETELVFCRFFKDNVVLTVLTDENSNKTLSIPLWQLGLLSGVGISILEHFKVEFSDGIIRLPNQSDIYNINLTI